MGSPDIPEPKASPAAPDAFDSSVRNASLDARARRLAQQGRMSMFLTGPKGLPSPISPAKSVLGGV
jgi:hypothetical protein